MAEGPVVGDDGVARCPWGDGPAMRRYHDTEWGMPVRGETAMFERLSLEAFQAGLSWRTILDKRERFREVFHGFDVDAVAALADADLERLLTDPGIVRNRAKVEATRGNARAAAELRQHGGLESVIRAHRPDDTPRPATTAEMPTVSAESTALSKDLRKRGFRFVGPTTMHALMEAVGLVDTHLIGCHRRAASGEWGS
ncbi:DNA-3-methyladenine glycosylase I [Nocardioides mangrovicus]|uniref:DNA-3-methyladenine glycosylase I n=1 Tax=Nocardioides mangrovicus TaxID=2478913 RepID=A0A3L8P5Q8_9ACTN|nr:DNA-3-methyladenine glycosylase I [Nocardioides mangrovicus]RLV50575.1 DNA-3-methyladenine glycosylase I [Nocardioides mangrovicus]